MCSKKSLHFYASKIIGTPFEKWNLEGSLSITRHDYGIISSQNLKFDATLLEKKVIVRGREYLREELFLKRKMLCGTRREWTNASPPLVYSTCTMISGQHFDFL